LIRRVHIAGYKSLRNVDVRLRPLTVLFGPNSAGKSNFLDSLQLLSRVASSRTLSEAFEPPYRGTPLESFSFGPRGLAGQLEKEHLSFSIEIDIELSARTLNRVERQIAEMRKGNGVESKPGNYIKERLLRYRIELEILPRSGILRVADEYLAALRDDGDIKGSRKPFIERQGSRLRLRLEGQAHPTDHEIGLDHTLISRPLYPPHYPHVAALRRELMDWAFFYFEPRERMRAVNPVKEVRHIGMMGEELAAFLNTLRAVDPKQFGAIEKSLRTLVPQVECIDVQPNALGEVELKLQENGVLVPARLASEGTLRMLGLLAVASASEPSTLIAFEEPENGIHPRRIRLVAEFLKTRTQMGGTQFIVTTHSPLLPDLLPADALYVCHRKEDSTAIESFSDPGPLFLRGAIERSLDDREEAVPVSERILRGDFDG
jgi:predicted ATPase